MRRPFAWLRRQATALPLQKLLTTVTGAIIVVSGAFGGLDTVAPITLATPGEQFSDGVFTWRILDATVSDTPQTPYRRADPDRRFLNVVAVIHNDRAGPALFLDQGLDLPYLRHEKHPRLRRATRSGEPNSLLGPRLTDTLAYEWSIPRDAVEPGGEVTVRAWQKTMIDSLVNVGGQSWIPSDTVATQVTLPVRAA